MKTKLFPPMRARKLGPHAALERSSRQTCSSSMNVNRLPAGLEELHGVPYELEGRADHRQWMRNLWNLIVVWGRCTLRYETQDKREHKSNSEQEESSIVDRHGGLWTASARVEACFSRFMFYNRSDIISKKESSLAKTPQTPSCRKNSCQ